MDNIYSSVKERIECLTLFVVGAMKAPHNVQKDI